jgi:predicted transcriptional regulator
MKITLANAEAALDDVQRDTDKLRSQELRKAIADYIEAQREAIKALRRKLH